MSATIYAFPFRRVLPRVAIETTIESLIDLLDDQNQVLVDREPDEDSKSTDDEQAATSPEWQTRSFRTGAGIKTAGRHEVASGRKAGPIA